MIQKSLTLVLYDALEVPAPDLGLLVPALYTVLFAFVDTGSS
jgi:hypothetical protein